MLDLLGNVGLTWQCLHRVYMQLPTSLPAPYYTKVCRALWVKTRAGFHPGVGSDDFPVVLVQRSGQSHTERPGKYLQEAVTDFMKLITERYTIAICTSES